MWKVTLEEDRLVFTPFFGDPDADQDPDQLREELQDLKLENDRLQQRDTLMRRALVSICCKTPCDECMLKDNALCQSAGARAFLAWDILRELEEIG